MNIYFQLERDMKAMATFIAGLADQGIHWYSVNDEYGITICVEVEK